MATSEEQILKVVLNTILRGRDEYTAESIIGLMGVRLTNSYLRAIVAKERGLPNIAQKLINVANRFKQEKEQVKDLLRITAETEPHFRVELEC